MMDNDYFELYAYYFGIIIVDCFSISICFNFVCVFWTIMIIYSIGAKEENIAQGKRAMIEYCQQQPEFASQLTSEVRTKLVQRAFATPRKTEENDSEEQGYLELEQEGV